MKRLSLLSLILPTLSVAYPSTWVRIATDLPGIYEIPYGQLRNLGFDNPAEVGVVSRKGTHSVLHGDNSLLFFDFGSKNVKFENPVFKNNGLDIYSYTGTLFLTDAPGFCIEMKTSGKTSSPDLISSAAGYILHEADIYHNSTETGNIFWGEQLDHTGEKALHFEFDLPAEPIERQGMISGNFFFPPQHKGSISFSSGYGENVTLPATTNKATNLNPTILSSKIGLKSGRNSLDISYSSPDNADGAANLDYWIINYDFSIGETAEGNPSIIALPNIRADKAGRVRLDRMENPVVLDITDPVSPKCLSVFSYGIRNAFDVPGYYGDITPVICIKDENVAGLSPLSFTPVDYNPFESPLRAHAKEGADMVIVAPQWLMEEAESLARLHRGHDGMRVVATSIREVYDSYSLGHPTPEACKNMVSEFLKAPVKLRNLMLLGPAAADVRGMGHRNNPDSILIVPQCRSIHYERGAQPAIPYYGAPSFNINKNLETADVEIGIGLLPVVTRQEARDYVAKVERYLNDKDKSRHMADMLWMGGTGDNHTHDQQAVQLESITSKLFHSSLLQTVVAFDAYGARGAQQKIIDALDEGRGFMTYIGHAGPTGFGAVSNFFTGTSLFSTSDVLRLKNNTLPFLITAGCITTSCDKGERGIGEHLILSTPNGAIGGLLTVRETWSGQNFDFLTRFFTNLSNGFEWAEGESPTVGEVYARTLNDTRVANELAFLLVGDPALRIPVPTLPISADIPNEAFAGEWCVFDGMVADSEGNSLEGFNGSLCAKLMAPSFSEVSADYITGDENTKKLTVEYADEVMAICEADVENGRFSVKIPIPTGSSIFSGQKGRIILSAYDMVNERGAGASFSITFSEKASGDTQFKSNALSITGMEYDEQSSTVAVNFTTPNGAGVWRNSNPTTSKVWTDGNRNSSPFEVWLDGNRNSSPFEVWLDGNRLSSGLGQAEKVDDNDNYRRLITLPTLHPGSHSLDVSLEDASGEKTRHELIFEVGGSPAPLTLSFCETALYGSGHFLIDQSANEVKLIISDTDGVVRHTATINGNNITGNIYEWDGCDDNGIPLPSGLYRACILETGIPDGTLRSSEAITVAVVSANP